MLFADEPTTFSSLVTQAGILKLLARLRQEKGLTILLVTHDLPMAASVCDNLLVMKDETNWLSQGTPKQIIESRAAATRRHLLRQCCRV